MTINYQSTQFPNEDIFVQLLKTARTCQHDSVIDFNRDITADYTSLLTDVIQTRQTIWSQVPRSVFDEKGLIVPDTPYIFILAPASYSYIIASFSILSIGAALCTMSTETKESDALLSLQKTKSSIILADSMHMKQALKIKARAAAKQQAIHIVPITVQAPSPRHFSDLRTSIDPDWTIDPKRPSVLIMTSGTTGPSKAVVHGRRLFSLAYSFLKPGDVFLAHRSSAWIAGLTPLVSGILRGAQLEIVSRDIATIWDRFQSGRITVFYSVPSIWSALMDYYQSIICNLPPKIHAGYKQGASYIRLANVTGGSLLPHVRQFWTEELQMPLVITYAATEVGGLATMRNPAPFPDDKRRVGLPSRHVSFKLSDGDRGEILVKGPTVFQGYLDNPDATDAAFDEDGYYKTGDSAYWSKDEVVLMGRDSEFIRYYGHKVSVYDIEAVIGKLPYISQACVLAVPVFNNIYTEHRVGVVIRVSPSSRRYIKGLCCECDITLERLRDDLSPDLPFHMLPTAIHTLHPGEEIPKTVSDKFKRKDAAEKFFPVGEIKLSAKAEEWDKECQTI
ncbi:uncharacterized protein N7443_005659 [Penicillium atrosanguineum]|uniref:uncharacterized protein n=1 Tax=Penicillium atrosanguineum TaxID=1132637 RepID=UPI002382AC3F|nr:uncharacterized protein N7443_005659 [Penicillium atrosanguineum]KAJ5300657.1 hypothetical protein N7443_005659 [Penicillium atrosanguineum]